MYFVSFITVCIIYHRLYHVTVCIYVSTVQWKFLHTHSVCVVVVSCMYIAGLHLHVAKLCMDQ